MAIFMQSQKMIQDKTMQITALITLKFLLLGFYGNGQTTEQLWLPDNDSLIHIQIETDSLFDSPQRINLLIVPGAYPHKYSIEFGYQKSELLRTSQIAQDWNANAAINGGFFDMDSGGSVSYFEMDDSVISRSRTPGSKWAVPDSLTNGAIILYKNHILEIDSANLHQYYEDSKMEAFVMVSGPLLIKDSILQDLPDMKFTNNRHPRTCIGITEESIIFVTIDGRSETAAGMNLYEAQKFLLDLGCQDAINLDGGGSTSMWLKDKGLVNIPSDKTGERPVANALIILEE
jgi:exopolysaccharide biosynthesis protein